METDMPHDAEAPEAPAEPMPVSSVVRINAISVPPGAGPELERRFAQRAGAVEGSPGFLGFQLLRPTAGGDRYFVVTHWADEESFVAWRDGQGVAAHAGQRSAPVSTGAELLEFDVILDVHPAG
jgi:heme-degrading monooxygenase HmoA